MCLCHNQSLFLFSTFSKNSIVLQKNKVNEVTIFGSLPFSSKKKNPLSVYVTYTTKTPLR